MNQLILRATNSPYGDVNKGSVLSASELDGNFVSLKGEVIYTAESNTGLVTLKKINGDSFSFAVSATDTVITGGTFDQHTGSATFTNNTGGTFTVTGFTTGATITNGGVVITGGTYNPSTGTQTLTNSTGGTVNITGFFKPSDDVYTSGFTFNETNYDLTIHKNDGTSLTQNLHILAGDMTITGGTYNPSTGTATFVNNSGGTFQISGFMSGYTGGTYNQGSGVLELVFSDGHSVSVSGFFVGGIIEVDYNTFYSLITGELLEDGRYYLINDYNTNYEIPDFYVDGTPKVNIATAHSEIEGLIVFAIDKNRIDVNAWQPKYPNDKIKYDWRFNITENGVANAFGRITERIDEYNNRTDYDHRNIEFIRYISYNVDGQLSGVIESFESTIGRIRGVDTYFTSELVVGSVIEVEGACKVKVILIENDTELYFATDSNFTSINFTGAANNFYECSSNGRYESYKESYIAQFIDGEYSYFKTFAFDAEITEFGNVVSFGNYIGDFAVAHRESGFPFILANNVFGYYAQYNKMGDLFYNNTFGRYANSNTFGNNNNGNIFGENCFGNTIKHFCMANFISDEFTNNDIGNHFSTNVVRKGRFGYNIISNNFKNNKIFGNFNENTIGESFIENQAFKDVNKNVIGTDASVNVFSTFVNNKIGNYLINNLFNYAFENTIGDYCGSIKNTNYFDEGFNYNIIGDYFGNDLIYGGAGEDGGNYIGINFASNVIGNSFIYNLIDRDFMNNKIGDYFMSNTTNIRILDNNIGNYFIGNMITGAGFVSNKIGNYFVFNTINYNFTNNQIGDYFGCRSGNSIDFDFQNNIIGNYFGNDGSHISGANTIKDQFDNNKIGNYFYSNNMGGKAKHNTITDYFYNNSIGDGFGGNDITYGFRNNVIGDSFVFNKTKNEFSSNNVKNSFQFNTVKNIVSGIDFSSANHVYGTYACDLLNDNLSVLKLTYLDFVIGGYKMTSPTA